MAVRAQRDQIAFGVLAGAAAEPDVVNFELRRAPADLTAPPIALEYLLTQDAIGLRIEADPRTLRQSPAHEALRVCSTKRCFSAWGRKP